MKTENNKLIRHKIRQERKNDSQYPSLTKHFLTNRSSFYGRFDFNLIAKVVIRTIYTERASRKIVDSRFGKNGATISKGEIIAKARHACRLISRYRSVRIFQKSRIRISPNFNSTKVRWKVCTMHDNQRLFAISVPLKYRFSPLCSLSVFRIVVWDPRHLSARRFFGRANARRWIIVRNRVIRLRGAILSRRISSFWLRLQARSICALSLSLSLSLFPVCLSSSIAMVSATRNYHHSYNASDLSDSGHE